jgi:hypothetical protein
MIGTRHTFATYLAFAVDTIMKVLLREGVARGPWELVRLTGNRIRRLERRFNALLAMWRAGTLPAVGAVRHHEVTLPLYPLPQGEGDSCNTAAVAKRAVWAFPRGWGWISRQLAPVTGPHCVGTLCLAWEEPEMAAFFAAAPQVGRILRPLAHMIGAPLPKWLQLPKRARKPGLRRRAAAASRLRDARSEMIVPNRRLPPREQAEDAMRRSEASGKPIDLAKFKPEAYGWWAHPPRDGNCPPPKIGYGGQRWRPPKDYKPPRDD